MSMLRHIARAKVSTQLCVWLSVYIAFCSTLIYLALKFLDQFWGDYFIAKLPAHILSISQSDIDFSHTPQQRLSGRHFVRQTKRVVHMEWA